MTNGNAQRVSRPAEHGSGSAHGAETAPVQSPNTELLLRALDHHAIVSTTDARGRITFVNDKFVEISGYDRGELIGRDHNILRSDEHTEAFYRDFWRTISNGQIWSGEIKNIDRNGDPYWLKATIVPRLDTNGDPVEYISLKTDITREKASEAMRTRQASFDLLANEVYMFWADSLRFFYANKQAQARWGLDEHEILRRTPLELGADFTREELEGVLAPLLRGEQASTTLCRELAGADGKAFPAEFRIQLIEPENRKPRFVAILRDLSERMAAERAKTEFVASINHELRTPLTSLKGALALIQSGAAGELPERVHSLLGVADRSRGRLEALINDLLDIKKIEAGAMDSQMRPVPLAGLVDDVIGEMAGYDPEKGVRIIADGLARDLCVVGDRVRLAQVLANLLSNAVKFSHPGGRVSVALDAAGDWARLTVRDAGIGLTEDAQSRLFDRFTQADSSDRREAGGAGLGLSIVKSIVDAHGGRITVDSAPGAGATFTVLLRRCPESRARADGV